MRYVPDSLLQLGHRVWPIRPPKRSMTVVVKGTFDLVPDGRASFAAEPLPPTGELYVDDDVERPLRAPNDLAILKPRGEALVTGTAWAPGGRPAGSVVCEFSVGPIRKRFAVFGDRFWGGWGVFKKFSDPVPFVSMPLTMDRAWGHRDYAPNPYGRGRDPVRGADGAEIIPLPNLEHPAHLIDSLHGRSEPMIVGPLPLTSADRMRYAGTYDARYMRERWPYFPADFSYEFFQEAPEDQRLPDGYFRGDEPVSLTGLHPQHGSVRGWLPGVLPRACVDLDRDGVACFEEVPLRLDTVVWDGSIAKLLLVWRGVIDVATDALDEVRYVYVTHQWLADPVVHVDRLRARMQDVLRAEEQDEEEAEGEPPPPIEAPVDEVEPPAEEQDEDEADAEPDPEEAAREAAVEAQLAAAGVGSPPEAAPAHTPADPRKVLAAMAAAGIAVTPEMEEALLAEDEPEEAEEEPEEEPIPAPSPDPEGRALVEARIAAGQGLMHLDLSGVDLSEMDLSGQDLSYTMLGEAILVSTRLEGAVLHGANLVEARLSGAQLARADLTDADLTGATAVGAGFQGARLEATFLDGADLEGAVFTNATAHRASFIASKLPRANLAGADFHQADLSDAVLDHVDATAARFAEATLENASAVSACFTRATMTGVRAEQLRATEASFREVDAADSFWEKATLTRADFAKSNLARADFTEAVLIATLFDRCALEGARFDRAHAHAIKAQKSNLMEASFEGCDLSFADLRGSNLYGAELWRANTTDAELELADLRRTKLER